MASEEDFKEFVKAKVLEAISTDNSYRKHINKHSSEPWAKQRQASISRVMSMVKKTQNLVDCAKSSETNVGAMCAEVVSSMHAPTRRHLGEACCLVSQKKLTSSIDISRVNRPSGKLTVDPKYSYFVLMLYYTYRLEHVVKSMVKIWLERQDEELTKAELADKFFDVHGEVIPQMYNRFVEGTQYVDRSLQFFLTTI